MNPNTPPDHVNIEIDGAMTAPGGLDDHPGRRPNGIAIPRFCYHDRSCRSRPTAACAWSR